MLAIKLYNNINTITDTLELIGNIRHIKTNYKEKQKRNLYKK